MAQKDRISRFSSICKTCASANFYRRGGILAVVNMWKTRHASLNKILALIGNFNQIFDVNKDNMWPTGKKSCRNIK